MNGLTPGEPCGTCNDDGIVSALDGSTVGYCTCPEGVATRRDDERQGLNAWGHRVLGGEL